MDTPILEILAIMQATPADYFIFFMGIVVVLFVIFLYSRFRKLSAKYQILNTNHMALWVMIAPDAVKWHHTGEYHIDIKALADIAKSRNE